MDLSLIFLLYLILFQKYNLVKFRWKQDDPSQCVYFNANKSFNVGCESHKGLEIFVSRNINNILKTKISAYSYLNEIK